MKNNEHDMNEERFRLLIQRELDGEIRPEEEAELQQARGENGNFAAMYAEEQQLAGLIACGRDAIDPPADLAKSIGDRIFDHKEATPPGRSFDLLSYLRPLSVAACFMVLVSAAFFFGRQSVQAASDISGDGLLREKQLLLEKHPELDAPAVEKAYKECLKALEDIGKDAESRRSAAYRKLETLIEKQISRGKHKGDESK